MLELVKKVAAELKITEFHAANAVKLMFEEECTIPFVARYRKEMTGSMDEVVLRSLRDRYEYLTELEATKQRYLKVVNEHCKDKPELAAKLPELTKKFLACETKQALEDLYLPFKPKRRTKAQVAKEQGLLPLLDKILAERGSISDLGEVAKAFVTPKDTQVDAKLVVKDEAYALVGAAHILSEQVSETVENRALAREVSQRTGKLVSKKNETVEEGADQKKKAKIAKYENYFEFAEEISSAASHRVMAIRRGEAEKILKVAIEVDSDQILNGLYSNTLGAETTTEVVKGFITKAVDDAYRRLIAPSIETEIRLSLKSAAEEEAIKVFSKNLENLLLLPPIPGKTVMGVDPGLRTGSKLAVISATGKLLDHATIYPSFNGGATAKTLEAKKVVTNFVTKHGVQCIAIGNGTGSREIDQLIISVIKENKFKDVKRLIVNEAGASVYSTDDIAREEFPDLDPTIRSAVSIGRRLQDPLAELVKIDPRSIGVGQYQHDLNVTKLGRSLKETVESCVNRVGVNINTASYKLLSYVSGIGRVLAKNIVTHRDGIGTFQSREEMKKVTGFGPKAFEQAAGFLRVPNAVNPLDNSAVHPERYEIIETIARDIKTEVADLISKKATVEAIKWENYVTEDIGMPTLEDISAELIKPGRDPREDGTRLTFSDSVSTMEDLKLGMKLKGTVSNVTNFGAFVDIGVHQDGLVHVSQISDEFVSDAAQAISVGDVVDVTVIDIDMQRKRISLSCKSDPEIAGATTKEAKGNTAPKGNRGSRKNMGRNSQKGKNQRDKNSSGATMGDLFSKIGL